MLLKELRRLFFVGIISLAPLALTIYLLVSLFTWFDALFQPLVRPFLAPYYDHPIPGLGMVLGIFCILLIGVAAPSLIGKQLLNVTERIVERLPLAKMIYSGTKQIFDSFSHQNANRFSRVVMVPFPHEGTYSVGFVTRELTEGWVPGKKDYHLAVFVPTTPNPTGGYLIFVREADAIPLSVSVEEALKFVISVGLAKPDQLGKLPAPHS